MLDIIKNSAEVIEYIKRYKVDYNISVRNKLIEECWESLRKYSKLLYYKYKYFSKEDYEILMVEAFIDTIERYDTSRTTKFITYFSIRAMGFVIDRIRLETGRNNRKRRGFRCVSFDKDLSETGNHTYNLYDIYGDKRYDVECEYLIKETEEEKRNLDISKYEAVLSQLRPSKTKEVYRDYYINSLSIKECMVKYSVSEGSVRAYLHSVDKKFFPNRINKKNSCRIREIRKYDTYLHLISNETERKLLKLFFEEDIPLPQASKMVGKHRQYGYNLFIKLRRKYNKL